MLIYLLSLAVILIVWRIKDYFGSDLYKNHSKSSLPLFKTSLNLAFSSPEEIFQFPRQGSKKFNSSFRNNFFWMESFEICRARDVEHILGSSKHIDKSMIYNLLHAFLKTGLLTSNGEKWHKRRRMLTPAFHFDILKEFFEVFKEESDRLVETISRKVDEELDIVPVATQFTLNTICESAMGVKLNSLGNDGETYRTNLYQVGEMLLYRLLKPWLVSDFVFALFGYQKQLNVFLKPIHDFTKSIIRERKENFVRETDKVEEKSENFYFGARKRRFAMMDTLLQAQSQRLIDDEGIVEETDTFTFEGHDTTSAAMVFTLLLLAHNPQAQDQIFTEIQEVLHENEWTISEINKLELLDRVLKESMRIYPPVPFISRQLSEDLTIKGFTIPKGGLVNVHIFDVHRDPENFPDPERFDPDRFLPENCTNRSNFAFIAFSAGMRNCIGQKFATLELKMMLAKVIKNFKILPVTTREEIVFIADLVLRSKHPIKMTFKPRKI